MEDTGSKTWSHTHRQTHVVVFFWGWDSGGGLASVCLPFVCAGVVNVPVAILWRSLPHGERLADAQRRKKGGSIALTITTFPSAWITVSGRPQTVRSHNRISDCPWWNPQSTSLVSLSIVDVPERNAV